MPDIYTKDHSQIICHCLFLVFGFLFMVNKNFHIQYQMYKIIYGFLTLFWVFLLGFGKLKLQNCGFTKDLSPSLVIGKWEFLNSISWNLSYNLWTLNILLGFVYGFLVKSRFNICLVFLMYEHFQYMYDIAVYHKIYLFFHSSL